MRGRESTAPAEAGGFGHVPRETWSKLTLLADLAAAWNSTIRLMADADIDHVMQRHVADSLRVAPFIGNPTSYADFGSGAGFPGLVVSIATGCPVTLIESDQRKAAFLREAIRQTRAPARLLAMRLEDVVDEFDLVTARGVAPMHRLATSLARSLRPHGRALLHKGAQWRAELEQARTQWSFDAVALDATPDGGCILEIRQLRRLATADDVRAE